MKKSERNGQQLNFTNSVIRCIFDGDNDEVGWLELAEDWALTLRSRVIVLVVGAASW